MSNDITIVSMITTVTNWFDLRSMLGSRNGRSSRSVRVLIAIVGRPFEEKGQPKKMCVLNLLIFNVKLSIFRQLKYQLHLSIIRYFTPLRADLIAP